jgi:cytochrome d ubiquinol oxidase subunit II
VHRGHSGRSFVATALGAVFTVATLFTSLYPRVLVSRPSFENSLTVSNAASSHYALATITIVALILTPIVLLYQAWTYYVFRARLTGDEVEAPVG